MKPKDGTMQRKSDRLGNEPVFRLLMKLSIPSVIGMAVQAMYNVVDSIYVGHVSTKALSALSLAFPIQLVLIAVSVGIGVGATSLISRTLGKGDNQRANLSADHVMVLILFFSLVIAIIGFFFSHRLVGIFTEDPELLKMGGEYIRIIMVGSIAMFVPMISNGILRGEGNTFVPMLVMIIGAVLNIAIDPFLIFGIGPFPEMGVQGAAFATVISRAIGGIFVLFILFSERNEIKLNLREFKPDFSILADIFRVGAPAMMMQLLASVMLSGANLILAEISVTAVAVLGVYFRLQSFILMPVFGLGQGVMPIAGYNYGYKNPIRIKQVLLYGSLAATLVTFIGFFLFQIFPEPLLRLFNGNSEFIATGVPALKRISISFLFIGPTIIAANMFQSLGKGMPSLVISLLRTIVVLLPAMYLLSRNYGLDAAWFAFPISEVATFLMANIWLFVILKKSFAEMEQERSGKTAELKENFVTKQAD